MQRPDLDAPTPRALRLPALRFAPRSPSPPPCGARTRAGGTCRRMPTRTSRRCHLHGGNAAQGVNAPRYRHGLYSRDLTTRGLAWAAVLRGDVEPPRHRRPDLAALTIATAIVAPEDRRVTLRHTGAEADLDRAWARLPRALRRRWLGAGHPAAR